MRNPHQVTKDFEAALCDYTGAPYAVAVNSCTMALMLAVAWHVQQGGAVDLPRAGLTRKFKGWGTYEERPMIDIPKRTYVSVPMAIIHAGGRPTFRDEDWRGAYQLKPLPVWDSARWFTSGMYIGAPRRLTGDVLLYGHQTDKIQNFLGHMVCVSFHASKTLGLEQGGAILLDDPEADAWLRRARFDGRTEGVAPKDDKFDQIGWHAYMNPSTAAQGILRLHSLPRHNAPLPNDDYHDLSTFEIFR